MASGDLSLEKSLGALEEITEETHNEEIKPVSLSIWRKHLSSDNPLWGEVTARSFFADNNAHVIAIVDPRLPDMGIVGFFGSKDMENGIRVLDESCNWLREEFGIKNVYGPINGTITRDYRFNLEEDYKVPGEPVNPGFYVDIFTRANFKIFNKYVSGVSKHYNLFNKLFIKSPPSQKYKNIKLRPFDINDQIKELRIYHDLMNSIFPSQSIYCPVITWEERKYNVIDKKPIFDSKYTYFLEDSGKPIGMIIASEDRGRLIIEVLGVLKEYRGKYLSGLLIKEVFNKAHENKLSPAIFSLIRVGNKVYRMKKPGASIYRKYITMHRGMD